MTRALAAWGAKPPAWIVALAKACDAEGASQTTVGRLLGCSGSMVNSVLGKRYTARLARIEQRVRGELMKEAVTCPVLGEISKRDCLDNQRRPFKPTNSIRVLLFQTCPTCPNREKQ